MSRKIAGNTRYCSEGKETLEHSVSQIEIRIEAEQGAVAKWKILRSSFSTAKYKKIAVEFAVLAKTTATLPRARYNEPALEQPTIRFCRI